jgi:hypothetical protein
MAVDSRGQPTLRKPRTPRGFSAANGAVTAYGAGCNDCSARKLDTFDFAGTGRQVRGKLSFLQCGKRASMLLTAGSMDKVGCSGL